MHPSEHCRNLMAAEECILTLHYSCISIEELIDKKTLQSACIYAYMIGDQHLFAHLPIGPDSSVPVRPSFSPDPQPDQQD